MFKSLLCISLNLLALITTALPASGADWDTFKPEQKLQFDSFTKSIDTCLLFRHNPDDSVLGYSSAFRAGQQTIVYFDPTSCAGDSTYPFGVTGFSFTLLDPPSYIDSRLYKWPLELEVLVYALATPGNPCHGPGTVLCSIPVSCDSISFAYPRVGTVPFPSSCCLEAPFFIGVKYTDTSSLRLPSIMWDTDSSPALCDAFQFFDTTWYAWTIFWNWDPGFPFFWVRGEARSLACCDDSDGDLICAEYDNCPAAANPGQLDTDDDGVGDACDNCPNDPNPSQVDGDSDGFADACDNCPALSNPSQADTDYDGLGDLCDLCPTDASNDADGDGICGGVDNCPLHYNPLQEDADSDGTGDACEVLDFCVGLRGNVDGYLNDLVTVADVTYLVAFLFRGGPPPPVVDEADVNADSSTNIADLTYLVAYLFRGGPAPAPC